MCTANTKNKSPMHLPIHSVTYKYSFRHVRQTSGHYSVTKLTDYPQYSDPCTIQTTGAQALIRGHRN